MALSTSQIALIRLYTGDLTSGDYWRTDEQIQAAYDETGRIRGAAILLINSIIAEISRTSSEKLGSYSKSADLGALKDAMNKLQDAEKAEGYLPNGEQMGFEAMIETADTAYAAKNIQIKKALDNEA